MTHERVKGRVSVVVPTRNSGRTIGRCLDAARRQTHEDLEVIVVDNASSDDTPVVACRLADRVDFSGPERSAQRNRGAALATGEFVMFVDSDQTLSPEVAAQVVAAFERSAALGALVIPELARGDGFLAGCRSFEKQLCLGDRSVEAARAFRRSAFDAVGGYDEAFTAVEDYDLPDRIEQGWQLGRVDAVVWHEEGRVRLRDTFRKKRYYGRWLPSYFRTSTDRQRRFRRPSLVRRPGELARDPAHAAGLVVLKATDVLGLAVGAFDARRRGLG